LKIDASWKRRGLLARELDAEEDAGVNDRWHCGRRSKWWVIEDVHSPDAFLPYMGAKPRGLVENRSRATCTNAVHRVNFTSEVNREVACASTWTSLFDVVAELQGRHYGGGVLKLEPTAAQVLPVISEVARPGKLKGVQSAFKNGEIAAARAALDELYLGETLGLNNEQVTSLRTAAANLKEWRTQSRQPSLTSDS
jgi:hypothetical protein